MKRSALGLWLLIFLAAVGIAGIWAVHDSQMPVIRDLEQAHLLAAQGDWEAAVDCAGRARQRWEQRRTLTSALTNHGPMEAADNLFALMDACAASRDPEGFAAACTELAQTIRAIADAQSCSPENILSGLAPK